MFILVVYLSQVSNNIILEGCLHVQLYLTGMSILERCLTLEMCLFVFRTQTVFKAQAEAEKIKV